MKIDKFATETTPHEVVVDTDYNDVRAFQDSPVSKTYSFLIPRNESHPMFLVTLSLEEAQQLAELVSRDAFFALRETIN